MDKPRRLALMSRCLWCSPASGIERLDGHGGHSHRKAPCRYVLHYCCAGADYAPFAYSFLVDYAGVKPEVTALFDYDVAGNVDSGHAAREVA